MNQVNVENRYLYNKLRRFYTLLATSEPRQVTVDGTKPIGERAKYSTFTVEYEVYHQCDHGEISGFHRIFLKDVRWKIEPLEITAERMIIHRALPTDQRIDRQR
uniref:SnoaL-like domain-containing protein n=1 Tax=Romanomermis culicivorax TaxID=13658 RepID=A0A915J0E8_ROMCU